MSRHFPMSWSDWSGGVEGCYRELERLEAKAAAEKLSKEERVLLERLKEIRERYARTGHKRQGRKPRQGT